MEKGSEEMKLPIKKKYFDLIKEGKKQWEYRDAHITFVCEETGETLVKKVDGIYLITKDDLPEDLKNSSMFEDNFIIEFRLRRELRKK